MKIGKFYIQSKFWYPWPAISLIIWMHPGPCTMQNFMCYQIILSFIPFVPMNRLSALDPLALHHSSHHHKFRFIIHRVRLIIIDNLNTAINQSFKPSDFLNYVRRSIVSLRELITIHLIYSTLIMLWTYRVG